MLIRKMSKSAPRNHVNLKSEIICFLRTDVLHRAKQHAIRERSKNRKRWSGETPHLKLFKFTCPRVYMFTSDIDLDALAFYLPHASVDTETCETSSPFTRLIIDSRNFGWRHTHISCYFAFVLSYLLKYFFFTFHLGCVYPLRCNLPLLSSRPSRSRTFLIQSVPSYLFVFYVTWRSFAWAATLSCMIYRVSILLHWKQCKAERKS